MSRGKSRDTVPGGEVPDRVSCNWVKVQAVRSYLTRRTMLTFRTKRKKVPDDGIYKSKEIIARASSQDHQV